MSDGIELHSLYWPNMAPEIVKSHRAVFDHLGIKVEYTVEKVRHALWMDRILRERLPHLDAIGFVDIDCIPYSKQAVDAVADYARRTGSFVGLGQSFGYRPGPIYAAPAFLIVTRRAFDLLGRPRMGEGPDGDVAQSLSNAADAVGFPYRVLFPIGYNERGQGPGWRLGNFGHYGIGTEYEGGFFHNFNSRTSDGIELFQRKAAAIIAGEPQPRVLPHMSASFDVAEVSERQSRDLRYRAGLYYRRFRHWLSPRIPTGLRGIKNSVLRRT